MLRIGLTGGIGSGKSTIAKIFSSMGTPVYAADIESKKIAERPFVQQQIISHFGTSICTHSKIDNNKLASIVFNKTNELTFLNALLHPLIEDDFILWCKKQEKHAPYILMEAAILFESGMDKFMDYTLTVEAPLSMQIERCVKRNGSTPTEVEARIKNQMSAELRRKKANLTLINDEKHPLLPQVLLAQKQIQSLL
ncbi:MAG: dephospho-CoA kinase [Bacteroidales bacterium]